MDSRTRMALAMRQQIPDRVPVMCQLALGHYFLHTDIPPHKIWFTSEGFAEVLIALQQRYRFDGIVVNLPGRPPDLLAQVVSVEKTRQGERLTWDNGEVTVVPWDDNPHHRMADGAAPPRADFATLDPDNLAGLDDLIGYTWGVYHVPRLAGKTRQGLLTQVPPYFLRTIDLIKGRVGDAVSVHGEVFSPFTHFMELFDYENALVHLLTGREKAHALLDRLTEAATVWAVAQARRAVDAVVISSSFAGGPFINRRMYREFVLPYERRVAEAIKAEGSIAYTHTCGSIGDRLDLLLETGTQGIDTLDPPPLGNTNLADAKKQIGGRAFIKGNMNAVEMLTYKSKEEVIAHASERIRIGKQGGGYILSTACSVAPKMEPWKLELLVPLAEEMGKY